MRAIIQIKKRQDPIFVSRDRGIKIKEYLLNEKIPRDTLLDLGEWSGELREIRSVEVEEERSRNDVVTAADMEADEQKRLDGIESFRALPAGEKFKHISGYQTTSFEIKFKFLSTRKPTEAEIERFRGELLAYLEANPAALRMEPEVIGAFVKKLITP
jgi:hypothetical protein